MYLLLCRRIDGKCHVTKDAGMLPSPTGIHYRRPVIDSSLCIGVDCPPFSGFSKSNRLSKGGLCVKPPPPVSEEQVSFYQNITSRIKAIKLSKHKSMANGSAMTNGINHEANRLLPTQKLADPMNEFAKELQNDMVASKWKMDTPDYLRRLNEQWTNALESEYDMELENSLNDHTSQAFSSLEDQSGSSTKLEISSPTLVRSSYKGALMDVDEAYSTLHKKKKAAQKPSRKIVPPLANGHVNESLSREETKLESSISSYDKSTKTANSLFSIRPLEGVCIGLKEEAEMIRKKSLVISNPVELQSMTYDNQKLVDLEEIRKTREHLRPVTKLPKVIEKPRRDKGYSLPRQSATKPYDTRNNSTKL
ncbi:hypothetical protein Ciccas_009815 [Cichlidogyrus casuarinus]|uniref:Uncharacterized protein n=1 Tax=Cichlidogyrus casuarinus TaxID=1844966 RepID=A0ABD2Q0G1_9PLAT